MHFRVLISMVGSIPEVQAKFGVVVGTGDLDRSQVASGLIFEKRIQDL